MSGYNKSLGDFGEEYAAKYLKKKRYKILACKERERFAEVDIIASKGEYIVFIEVKTRETCAFGRPAEAVTAAKQRKIVKFASGYMVKHPEKTARFDVIEILADGFKVYEVNHIESAFY